MRTIKPGFFQNDNLAEIEPLGRLLFAGLWTIADREGRLEDRPKRIKIETLPYDNCDIDSLLNSLAEAGFITRYESGGTRYIQVNNFTKHQSPHQKEPDSSIPSPVNKIDEHQKSTGQEPNLPEPEPEPAPEEPPFNSNFNSNCKRGDSRAHGAGAGRRGTPVRDALEEIFPALLSDFLAGDKATKWAMDFKATPEQIRAFPGWMERNHPLVGLTHWSFRDYFHKSLKGDRPGKVVPIGLSKSEQIYQHNMALVEQMDRERQSQGDFIDAEVINA